MLCGTTGVRKEILRRRKFIYGIMTVGITLTAIKTFVTSRASHATLKLNQAPSSHVDSSHTFYSRLFNTHNGGNPHLFKINTNHISFLKTPSEFKECLVKHIKTSEHRVVLSSLYLGTGPDEQDIVDDLLAARKNSVKIHLLLDGHRGTRGSANSVTMLRPLFANQQTPNQVSLSLYFNDAISNLLSPYVSEKIHEIFGVHHIKIYIFDNTILLSGANLSDQYFTSRQDRYVLIQTEPILANYLVDFLMLFSSHCHTVSTEHEIDLITKSPRIKPANRLASKDLHAFFSQPQASIDPRLPARLDINNLNEHDPSFLADSAILAPSFQLPPFNIYHDTKLLSTLLTSVPSNMQIALSSGYLNLPPPFPALLADLSTHTRILTAAPDANSFFDPNPSFKHPAGFIPRAYFSFYMSLARHIRARNLDAELYQYTRRDWTFHAKGIWISTNSSFHKSEEYTLIGSPNYGYRWAHRDLDMQMAIYTQNAQLKNKIHDDLENIFDPKTISPLPTSTPQNLLLPSYIKGLLPFIKSFL